MYILKHTVNLIGSLFHLGLSLLHICKLFCLHEQNLIAIMCHRSQCTFRDFAGISSLQSAATRCLSCGIILLYTVNMHSFHWLMRKLIWPITKQIRLGRKTKQIQGEREEHRRIKPATMGKRHARKQVKLQSHVAKCRLIKMD